MSDPQYHPIGSAFDVGRALSNALTAVRAAAGPLWLGGLLTAATSCGGSGGTPLELLNILRAMTDVPASSAMWSENGTDPSLLGQDASDLLALALAFVVTFLVLALLIGLLLFAAYGWLEPGFIRLQRNVLTHASDALAPLFSGRDVFWRSLGWNALDRLILSAVFFVAAWPGALLWFVGRRIDSRTVELAGMGLVPILGLPAMLYVGLGTFLGSRAVALESLAPVAALRRSWALAHGNRIPLLWFGVVFDLVAIVGGLLGLLACGVGALFSFPLGVAVAGFARTESFLLMTQGMGASLRWQLWQREAHEEHAGALARAALATAPPDMPRGRAPRPAAPEPKVGRPASREVPRGWDTHLLPPSGKPDQGDDER